MSNHEQFDPLGGRELPSPEVFLAMSARESPLLFQAGITQLHHQMLLKDLLADLQSRSDVEGENWVRSAIAFMQNSTEAPLMVTNYPDDRTGATYYGLYRFAVADDKVDIILQTELQMVFRHPNGNVDMHWGDTGAEGESYERLYESVFGDLHFTPEQARLIADLGDGYPVPGSSPAYVWDDSEGELHR